MAKRGLGYTQTGTPYYASPEVWKDQPYDCKSDIWSLGCVLYEMITLKPPFRAENMEGLYNKVIKGQISKIPDRFSEDLAEIVKILLQVNPDNRPNCGKYKKIIKNFYFLDQILKLPCIQKRIEYFKNFTDEPENIALLQTIRIPKNLLFLSDKLPKANYGKNSLNNINNNKKNNSFTNKIESDLPDIKGNLSKLNSNSNVNNIKRKKVEDISDKKNNVISNLISEIQAKNDNSVNVNNNNNNKNEEILIKKRQKNPKNLKNINNYNSLNIIDKSEDIAHVYLEGIYNKKTRSQSPKLDYLINRKQYKLK